jgi:hypothetical protein
MIKFFKNIWKNLESKYYIVIFNYYTKFNNNIILIPFFLYLYFRNSSISFTKEETENKGISIELDEDLKDNLKKKSHGEGITKEDKEILIALGCSLLFIFFLHYFGFVSNKPEPDPEAELAAIRRINALIRELIEKNKGKK